jgi:hypothetical protein
MSDGVGSPLKALSAEEAAMMKRLQARAAAFSSPPSKPSAAVAPKEMSTSKKIPKIKRDPLAASAHEARYEKPSQDGAYFASKQRVVPTEASDKAASDKAHRAVMSQWKVHQERVEEARAHFERGREIHIDVETLVEAERTTKVTPADRAKALKGEGVSTARRNAVFFFYTVVLGSPPPKDEKGKDLWGGQRGVNAEIRAALFIPEGSSRIVADVLADSWAAYQTGEKYDADGRLRMRGRKASIQEMSDEAYIIYRAKRIGMSLGDCTVLVSEFMRSNGREMPSRTARCSGSWPAAMWRS